MSSIIVKGMRMPENCSECMSSDLRTTIKCTEWTEISAGRRENERAWSCPLVDLDNCILYLDKNLKQARLMFATRSRDLAVRRWNRRNKG